MDSPPAVEKIDSRKQFQAAVRAAIERAEATGAGEMIFADADFDDWPIDERAVVETLARWSSASRKLTLIAGSFDALARRAPRFVAWRQQWSHIVSCRIQDEIDAEQVPTLLWVAGQVTVRLDDRLRRRGIVSTQAVDQVAAREAIDALLQRSIEAFPATTLGL